MFSSKGNTLQYNTDTLPSRNIFINHKDAVAIKQKNSLLISAETSNGNELILYDATTQNSKSIKIFEKAPQKLYLSDDESTLYITYKNNNTIEQYSTRDFSLLQKVYTTEYQTVHHLDISPTDNNAISVVTTSINSNANYGFDIVIFQNGKQLPKMLSNTTPKPINSRDIYNTHFTTDGKNIISKINEKTAWITIDENGINEITYIDLPLSAGKNIRKNGLIYTHDRSINTDSQLISGSYFHSNTSFNEKNQLIFDAYLNVFDMQSNALLQRNDIKLPNDSGQPSSLSLNDTTYILANNIIKEIEIAAIKERTQEPPKDCRPVGDDYYEDQYVGCNIIYIAFHEKTPDTIYAITGSNAGKIGNSIIFLNKETLAIEKQIKLHTEPQKISISGDGDALHVAYKNSHYFGYLKFSSENSQVELTAANKDILPSHPAVAHLLSSPTDNDIYIQTLAPYSPTTPQHLIVYKEKEPLHTIHWSYFLNSARHENGKINSYTFNISNDGFLYTFIEDDDGYVIKKINIQGETLETEKTITLTRSPELFIVNFTALNNELFLNNGIVVNLENGTTTKRFDRPYSSQSLLFSEKENKIYSIAVAAPEPLPNVILVSYQKSTGDFISSRNLGINDFIVKNSKLIELPDELAFVGSDGAIYKIPKH